MNDFVIIDARVTFAASKNPGYRTRTEQRYRVFVNFLQENKLLTREVLPAEAPVTEDLQIRKSDLTGEGFELVKKAYDKWLRGIDKGHEISDVSILTKALSKIREGSP